MRRADIIDSWSIAVRRAVTLGEGETAYRLTIGAVRRCRELYAPAVFLPEPENIGVLPQ